MPIIDDRAPPPAFRSLDGVYPHVTTAGFVFDSTGRIVLLHRSANVRSAKNAWSLPSGLHEVGLTLEEQLKAELKEELGLTAAPLEEPLQLGVYENIARVDRYHWVIVMFVIRVNTLDDLVNREPDKHDDVQLIHFADFDPAKYVWAPALREFIDRAWPGAKRAIAWNLAGIGLSRLRPHFYVMPPDDPTQLALADETDNYYP